MEQALGKIRPHTNSSLAHQKAPATLLHALEATFAEQNTDRSPTAYFAALLTTLDGTLQKERSTGPSLGEGDVLPAELYLLALAIPYVPPAVVRTHLNTLLSLTAPLFPLLTSHAPPLRSQLTIYSSLIQALERPQLEAQLLRQSFASILQLCLDPRPKVRKRAAEVVKEILDNPPVPLVRHPYADKVAEWVTGVLGEVNANGGSILKFKGKKSEGEGTESAVHLLAFLRPVLHRLPPSSLPRITTSLLSLPRFGNPYLSQSSYNLLSDLLSSSPNEINPITSEIPSILQAILSSQPQKTDTTIAPAWVIVVGRAMVGYRASLDEEGEAGGEVDLWKVWKAVYGSLEATDGQTRKAAAESLGMLTKCLTPSMIEEGVKEGASDHSHNKTTLGKIVSQTTRSLGSIAFASSMPELLDAISSLVTALRYRLSPNAPSAAESILLPLITRVGDLRMQPKFEYKEAVDGVLGVAMGVLGPEVFLRVLPLNLEPQDRKANRPPRAFILPLLPLPHPSPLSHFITYFVPLSERMFEYQTNAEAEGRASEGKMWSVLVGQVWAGLVGYCVGGGDLSKSLTPQFAQLLSQLLYTQPELRPSILKALKAVVESNLYLSAPPSGPAVNHKYPTDISTPEQAQSNVAFLRTQAESWLAVLFNVFGSVDRDERPVVGDVITVWASLAGEQEVTKAYAKVLVLFKQNLAKLQSQPTTNTGNPAADSITATTQDLLLILLPYLSTADARALFECCLSPDVLGSRDNGVQKRGYKILAKLVESGKIRLEGEAVVLVLQKLGEVLDKLTAAAKKDRFHLLTALLPSIPSTSLHLLPSLIPEAVLGTKEPSEKARTVAFDLIVAMGKKMGQGGVVKRNMVDGMDEDEIDAGEVNASVEEFMTMVAGGLAGATPHMISATITAVSRLVFEFKESISTQMQSEILATLLVFVSSANREIVKSSLGFVKLAIHTLPVELVRPQLSQIVPALLGWSHDHKNHFKLKVRHIFERMIRRFGWADVYACAGEEDAKKVLVNIKKRKDRAKRRRARAEEDGEEEELPSSKPATGDAFEDVLYGSESELDSSEDEDNTKQSNVRRKGKDVHGARLRIDDDEPMDLLEGAASKITGTQSKRRKPGQDAARFKTDDDSGKMVIDESESDEEADVAEDVEGTAYKEGLTSVDGFTRGPNGRVKFNKDTKKRRRENQDADQDVEMKDADADAVGDSQKKAKQRKTDLPLGHEFKAKKAGGDIKRKGGPDPYAYMSLSQAAKKGRNGRGKLGIASRR